MERPTPTKQLIIELCGEDLNLINSAHHGLYETSLNNFYPCLDMDETIAFAASSWKSRERNHYSFTKKIESADIYEIFTEVFKIGVPWLKKHKNVSEDLRTKYERLNPFKGDNLRERLGEVSAVAGDILRQQLLEEVNEYVFECQYHDRKMARGGDNHKLELMHFQPVYPNKKNIVSNFASEIVRMFSTKYPAEYITLDNKVALVNSEQPALF